MKHPCPMCGVIKTQEEEERENRKKKEGEGRRRRGRGHSANRAILGETHKKVPPTTTLGPGATLKFQFAPQACHLFDAAGGGRLS